MAGYRKGGKRKGGMVKRAKTFVRKRYRSKGGGMRVGKLAKDVMYLKSVLNPEKKRSLSNSLADGGSLVVGQVNGNVDGAFLMTAHPTISTGTGFTARNGASVKLHSSIWQFNFNQQSSATVPQRLCLEIWSITDQVYASNTTFFENKWDVNPFIGTPFVRDYNSQYDPDYYTMGKCIARRNITVKGDDLSGQKQQTVVKIPMKYNKGQGHHLRYQGSSDTLTAGQLIMVIRANRGNCSTVVTSAMTGILDTAPLTGVEIQYNVVHYFYDN